LLAGWSDDSEEEIMANGLSANVQSASEAAPPPVEKRHSQLLQQTALPPEPNDVQLPAPDAQTESGAASPELDGQDTDSMMYDDDIVDLDPLVQPAIPAVSAAEVHFTLPVQEKQQNRGGAGRAFVGLAHSIHTATAPQQVVLPMGVVRAAPDGEEGQGGWLKALLPLTPPQLCQARAQPASNAPLKMHPAVAPLANGNPQTLHAALYATRRVAFGASGRVAAPSSGSSEIQVSQLAVGLMSATSASAVESVHRHAVELMKRHAQDSEVATSEGALGQSTPHCELQCSDDLAICDAFSELCHQAAKGLGASELAGALQEAAHTFDLVKHLFGCIAPLPDTFGEHRAVIHAQRKRAISGWLQGQARPQVENSLKTVRTLSRSVINVSVSAFWLPGSEWAPTGCSRCQSNSRMTIPCSRYARLSPTYGYQRGGVLCGPPPAVCGCTAHDAVVCIVCQDWHIQLCTGYHRSYI
jgi:hypothetical protein